MHHGGLTNAPCATRDGAVNDTNYRRRTQGIGGDMVTGPENRLATGISGLDEVLQGGLIPQRTYLIHGGPGLGKTSIGLHFLTAGKAEDSLLITMSEPAANLQANAGKIGLDLANIPVIDVSPNAPDQDRFESYTLLESWDAEGTSEFDRIFEELKNKRANRVFIDSLSLLRHLSPDTYQFRKQILSLLQFLTQSGATVVFTAEQGVQDTDEDLQFLSDGILKLERHETGRTLSVNKFRGSGFAEGQHFYRINNEGVSVFPRLVPADHTREFIEEYMVSGVPELDELTGGGISRGTVTIISGPTGVGKTSVGAQFMKEAASRGERSVIYCFEENLATFKYRSEKINIPITDMMARGTLAVEQIEPLAYTPDEFAAQVRREVEERGASIVMLDSLSGYRQSIVGENLVERVHALCRYLVNMGVTVLLINEVDSITGLEFRVSNNGISYLSDTIIILRYVEMEGSLKKTIGVLKKRTGDFEKTLRWFDITAFGLKVDEPIKGFRGILQGMPEVVNN